MIKIDFGSEGALATSKGHILALVVLGRRDAVINTIELWKEKKVANSGEAERLAFKLHGQVYSLFLEVEEVLQRRIKESESGVSFEKIKEDLEKDQLDNNILVSHFKVMNKILDKLNLTRFDTMKNFDRTNVELENENKNL